ncbi:hypothetical protein DFH08DRAFT_951448 [Mycena albidolilacea]|uniref:Thioester reductase (TE) domain-containing protein n=1 Tax=Mycena albidolilacea TaxID=1033008 RepID=A0AAD7AK24_9AGAR|nr:hypothetical protein DFH08DRAFT_951448 [Mycena albidolilacea]
MRRFLFFRHEPLASWSSQDLEPWLKTHASLVADIDIRGGHDLFDQSFDSLNTTFLRHRIVGALKNSGATVAAQKIPQNFVYAHLSIEQLATAIATLVRGGADDSADGPAALVEKMIAKYSEGFEAAVSHDSKSAASSNGTVVFLTGSTGGLGSHVLEILLSLSVFTHSTEGVKLQLLNGKKLVYLEGDTAKEYLGLPLDVWTTLCDTLTAIIHNAWTLDFNKGLSSFELHFDSCSRRLHRLCPELGPNAWSIPRVSERILAASGLEATSFRIGQVTGSSSNGAWSTTDWVPAIVKSSTALGNFPSDPSNVVAWITPEAVFHTIVDAALSVKRLPFAVNLYNFLSDPSRTGSSNSRPARATAEDIERILLDFFKGAVAGAGTTAFSTLKAQAIKVSLTSLIIAVWAYSVHMWILTPVIVMHFEALALQACSIMPTRACICNASVARRLEAAPPTVRVLRCVSTADRSYYAPRVSDKAMKLDQHASPPLYLHAESSLVGARLVLRTMNIRTCWLHSGRIPKWPTRLLLLQVAEEDETTDSWRVNLPDTHSYVPLLPASRSRHWSFATEDGLNASGGSTSFPSHSAVSHPSLAPTRGRDGETEQKRTRLEVKNIAPEGAGRAGLELERPEEGGGTRRLDVSPPTNQSTPADRDALRSRKLRVCPKRERLEEEDRFRTSSTHSWGRGTVPCATTSRTWWISAGLPWTAVATVGPSAPVGSTTHSASRTTHPPQSTQLVYLLLNIRFRLLNLPSLAPVPTGEKTPSEREGAAHCEEWTEEWTPCRIFTQGAGSSCFCTLIPHRTALSLRPQSAAFVVDSA